VDLDGLVAEEEKTYAYDEPPVRWVRRTFEFPGLARPGAFVVEWIGGGISSRALFRKGPPLPDASLWLSGHEFRAEQGEIRVRFSAGPGRHRNRRRQWGSW